MTVAGLVIFIIKLASPRRCKPMMTETGGIVPCLSMVGRLAFTTGFGLVVYDQRKYLVRVNPTNPLEAELLG